MDAPKTAQRAIDALDPRIRRSRRMLHEALATLLTTKDFDKISIQDIAEASTLNRATFYDHYPDKFALLQCMVGSRFSELMAVRGIRVDDCTGALRAIALAVCDYLAETSVTGGKLREESMQSAIVGVIRTMLSEGLRDRAFRRNLSPDVVASTVAWAIYGGANAWLQTPQRCPAEQMAEMIDTLINPMLAAAASNANGKRGDPGGVSAHAVP